MSVALGLNKKVPESWAVGKMFHQVWGDQEEKSQVGNQDSGFLLREEATEAVEPGASGSDSFCPQTWKPLHSTSQSFSISHPVR